MLRKINRVINKFKKKYWKTNHKFGIRVPKSVAQPLQIYKENLNDLCEKSIREKMSKVSMAYVAIDNFTPEQVVSKQYPSLITFQEIKCHMIFDIKIYFTRKARFLEGGHMAEAPPPLTYSSVL